MFEQHEQASAAISKHFMDLARIADSAGEEVIALRIRDVVARRAGKRFQLAVVGEFKAGKSTLINGLVGRDLLPTQAAECTTVVTRIRQTVGDEEEHASALHAAGAPTRLDLSMLESVLKDRDPRIGGRPIEEIEVALQGVPWLSTACEIVDTPGVNAANKIRERATLAYLPNADAVLFLTRADMLLTAAEQQFLQDRVMSQDRSKVFVVINRMDEIRNERDRAATYARAAAILTPVLGTARVAMISAWEAIDAGLAGDQARLDASRVPALRAELVRFLTESRGAAELATRGRMLERFTTDLRRRVGDRLADTEADAEERKEKRLRVEELLSCARAAATELTGLVESQFAQLAATVEASVPASGEQLRHALNEVGREVTGLSEQRARGIADTYAGRALAQVQQGLRSGVASIHREVALRLEAVLRKTAGLPGLDASVRLEPFEIASYLELHTTKEEQEEQIKRQRPDADQHALLGGVFGGMLGSVFGPVGMWIGAAIGASLARDAAKQNETIVDTVKRVVLRHKINTDEVVGQLVARLQSTAQAAVKRLSTETASAVAAAVRSRTTEIEERMDQLGAAARTEDVRRLRDALAQLEVFESAHISHRALTSGETP